MEALVKWQMNKVLIHFFAEVVVSFVSYLLKCLKFDVCFKQDYSFKTSPENAVIQFYLLIFKKEREKLKFSGCLFKFKRTTTVKIINE